MVIIKTDFRSALVDFITPVIQ